MGDGCAVELTPEQPRDDLEAGSADAVTRAMVAPPDQNAELPGGEVPGLSRL